MLRSLDPTATTVNETETFSVMSSGRLIRSVRTRARGTITTDMGVAEARHRETLADRAERALLTRSDEPSAAQGRAVRYVDLYAGCGGLSLGLKEAGRAIGRATCSVASFELDRDAGDIYAANFPETRLYREDITHLLGAEVDVATSSTERSIARRAGGVDFLLAGPPCQGFSSLNNHTRGD